MNRYGIAAQDHIIEDIKAEWELIAKAIPSLETNQLASAIYSLLTFGIKTGTQAYLIWKKNILSKPLSVPLIDDPPDSSAVINFFSSNPVYKIAFKDELSDFVNNDILLKKAFVALNQLEQSESLKFAFSHLIDTKNYKAFVLCYDRLSDGSGNNVYVYEEFRNTLKKIEADMNARSALDEIFKTIKSNLTSDIINNQGFWKDLKEILRPPYVKPVVIPLHKDEMLSYCYKI